MPKDIDTRMIKPQYSDSMRFPITVTVPMNVAVHVEGGRHIRIKNADQDLPALAVEWMRNDSRYGGWFDGDADINDSEPDDLTVINGVGQTTARRLADAGIATYGQLASVDAAYIVEVVDSKRLNEEKAAEIIREAKGLA